MQIACCGEVWLYTQPLQHFHFSLFAHFFLLMSTAVALELKKMRNTQLTCLDLREKQKGETKNEESRDIYSFSFSFIFSPFSTRTVCIFLSLHTYTPQPLFFWKILFSLAGTPPLSRSLKAKEGLVSKGYHLKVSCNYGH